MRRVLVVDDEYMIRIGIKTIIERCPDRSYHVDTCSDGEEALAYMSKNPTDILFTDIRMPGIDGLTLIGRIADAENRPETVIISGYDDFSYASSAIKYGVRDYLLKPVRREDVYECLTKLEKDLNRKKQYGREMAYEALPHRLDENKINYILLKDFMTEKEVIESLKNMEFPVDKAPFFAGIFRQKPSYRDSEGTLAAEVEELVRICADETGADYYLFADRNDNQVVFFNNPAVCDRLYSCNHKNMSHYTLGLCDEPYQASEIPEAYQKAQEALDCRFFGEGKNVYRYLDCRQERKNFPLIDTEIQKLRTLLFTGKQKESILLVRQLFDISNMKKNSTRYLQSLHKACIQIIFRDITNKYSCAVHVAREFERLVSLNNYSSYQELCCDIEKYINCLVQALEESTVSSGDPIVDKAVHFINENYSDSRINMTVVSNLLSVNYSYFSNTFKEHVHENFIDYLLRIRMEKAKELLRLSNFKVYEIAEKVGYKDVKQFTKSFDRYAGISPKEYRISAGGTP